MPAMEAKVTKLPTIQDVPQRNNAISAEDSTLANNQKDTAQYVADMILELRNMAKGAKLFKVMVPLEFAYYEAFAIANKVSIPKEEIDRLNVLAKTAQEFEPVDQAG
jgi:hypothetical protein